MFLNRRVIDKRGNKGTVIDVRPDNEKPTRIKLPSNIPAGVCVDTSRFSDISPLIGEKAAPSLLVQYDDESVSWVSSTSVETID